MLGALKAEVCIEVAREVMARVPGSALDWSPVVRYKEFGDSNIHFIIVLRVKEFAAQYLLMHEFIKALFRRFKREGIEIAYPMRNVILRTESAAADGCSGWISGDPRGDRRG